MKIASLFVGGVLMVSAFALAQSPAPRTVPQQAISSSASTMSVASQQELVNQYCVSCHNEKLKSGGFSWTVVDLTHPDRSAEQAEKIIRKLRSGMMPPAGARRPDATSLKNLASTLETEIDRAAAKQAAVSAPNLHRLNRTEYHNSIHDLLDLDVDVTELLPPDAKTGGFDNMAEALTVTPTLMQAYIRSAEKITRLAVGDAQASPTMVSYRVPKVANQMGHVEGTPFGTRGGLAVTHNFPADGNYTFKTDLYYSVTGELVGSALPDPLKDQELEISVDGRRAAVFKIDPAVGEAEANLTTEPIAIKAGPHRIAAAFISKFDGSIEDQYTLVDHTLVTVITANNPRMTLLPHLQSVFITGPLNPSGVSETPSRNKIFTCRPSKPSEEDACATAIISRLAGNAFRRPINAEDMEGLMGLYKEGRQAGNFETGVRLALQDIVASPEFIFRLETLPGNTAPGQIYPISDVELASRLSYFLWSSAPDEQLLAQAQKGDLKVPAVLERQVRRMLADPRSYALASNFAGQWLRLRGLTEIDPDGAIFPSYTQNLGISMKRELELLFDSIVREDRNILELLTADYTFVDQIMANFYGMPNISGSDFRRVKVTDPTRIGLLGKAGFLRMTSLANRTTPVGRGKYILEVLIGTPPPTPPPNVPPLKEAGNNEKVLSVRERMEQHRKVEPCRSCHQIMDPIGLALENFDAIGRARTMDNGLPIDPVATMYDGTKLDGIVGVRKAIMDHSESFINNFTERLTAYSLGRVLDYRDMPTVRSIAHDAAKNNNRFSSFVMAIVKNPAFQMTKNPESQNDK